MLEQTGATDNLYRYRGEQYDPDLDAYYLRARYYHQDVGRFSVMDPMEGTISFHSSWHRYIYAYNDPVHNLDPSGKMTLNEQIGVVGIISTLSSMSVQIFGSIYEDVAVTLADIFPDAGLVGISAIANARLYQWYNVMRPQRWITARRFVEVAITKQLKILMPGAPPTLFEQMGPNQPVGNIGLGGGVEILFSLPSAEISLYGYFSPFQMELGQGTFDVGNHTSGDFIDVSLSLYHGGVFNLWNADEYAGGSILANLGLNGTGLTLFSSLPPWGNVPWGATVPAATLWSNNSTFHGVTAGISGSSCYRIKALTWPKVSMYSVAIGWTVAEAAVFAASAIKHDPSGMFSAAMAVSWPMTIAKLKGIWNTQQTDTDGNLLYSIEKRRSTERRPKKPKEYHSGPAFFRF